MLFESVSEANRFAVDYRGRTLLHVACERGHADHVEMLFEHGFQSKVNKQDFQGQDPLCLLLAYQDNFAGAEDPDTMADEKAKERLAIAESLI